MSNAIKAIYKLDQLAQRKAPKHKRNRRGNGNGYGHGSHSSIPLKTLLKTKTLKKINRDELVDELDGNMKEFKSNLFKYFQQGYSKLFEDIDDIADVFLNNKFARALTDICKDEGDIDPLLVFTISELHLKKVFQDDEKVLKRYLQVIADSEEDRIKKLRKVLKVSNLDALLIILLAQSYKGCPRRFMRDRTYQFLNVLYEAVASEELGYKDVEKAIKIVHGRNMEEFMLTVLLEKAQNRNNLDDLEKEGFDLVTEWALKTMNKMDNDERRSILKEYTKARRQNAHVKRRINFMQLDGEEYRRIKLTVDRLVRNNISKDLLS